MFDACTMSQVVMSRKEKNVPKTGTIRTVDMLMKNKPRWNSVSSKMHYCITFHENGRYRVFAQAKASIRQRQWERLFDAYGVLKQFPVRGFFEEYKQAIQAEIESTPQTELEVAQNRIRELEDKIAELEGDVVRLRGKLIAHNKRKAAEMSADESEAEEAVEGETTIYYDESEDEDTAHDQSGAEE